MELKKSIEVAVSVVGSQRELAKRLGVSEQALSDYKHGRKPCGIRKRAVIAQIAGEDVTRTLLQYVIDSLDDTNDYQAEGKKALSAILSAFPPETDEPLEVAQDRWRKR